MASLRTTRDPVLCNAREIAAGRDLRNFERLDFVDRVAVFEVRFEKIMRVLKVEPELRRLAEPSFRFAVEVIVCGNFLWGRLLKIFSDSLHVGETIATQQYPIQC